MKPIIFACRNCGHSAGEHSHGKGSGDTSCMNYTCFCDRYSSVFLDALKGAKA